MLFKNRAIRRKGEKEERKEGSEEIRPKRETQEEEGGGKN